MLLSGPVCGVTLCHYCNLSHTLGRRTPLNGFKVENPSDYFTQYIYTLSLVVYKSLCVEYR